MEDALGVEARMSGLKADPELLGGSIALLPSSVLASRSLTSIGGSAGAVLTRLSTSVLDRA